MNTYDPLQCRVDPVPSEHSETLQTETHSNSNSNYISEPHCWWTRMFMVLSLWHENRRILEVVCITDKLWEARLRRFGHVQRREEEDCVKRILEADTRRQRSRERQRKRWIDVVKYNMEDLWLDLVDVDNRAEWRRRTCVADPSPERFTGILFKLVVCVHKCLDGRAPAYVADDCHLILCRRSGLRSSSSASKLEVPPTRTTFGDRSVAIDGPRVWNSLPASIRDPSLTFAVFSNRLKFHLFGQ